MGAFMKKSWIICFAFLLSVLLGLSGCVTRDTSQGGPDATPAPLTGDMATATPEPTPTPLPYELAAQADPADCGLCESDSDVFDALERIRANAAAAEKKDLPISGTSVTDEQRTGDTVAQDDSYIYLLSDIDLVIVKADGENSEVISRTPVGVSWKGETDDVSGAYQGKEKIPVAVFCGGGRAAVLCDRYGYETVNGVLNYSEYISVEILDVSDPAAPKQLASLGQDGALRGAGLVDGQLLLLTDYRVFDDADRADPKGYIPAYYYEDEASLVPGDRIFADRDGIYAGGAVLGLYDLGESRLADIEVLWGVSADAAVSGDAVVFHSPRRVEAVSRDTAAGQEIVTAECTDLFVYRVQKGSLGWPAVAAVNGSVPDSGCLNWSDGTLRCLTFLDQRRTTTASGTEPATGDEQTGPVLQFLNEDFSAAGSLRSMPDGSPIGWACFAGDKILLTNADRSGSCTVSVNGASPEPGAMLSDGTVGRYVLRFGENYAFYDQNELGKMTLTVCDGSMKRLASKTFGSDHSSTLENHRAYLADAEADLLTLTADDSYCVYGLSAEKGIELRAGVYLKDWAWKAKGLRVGDFLYVVDTKEVRVLSLTDLKEVLELTL